jgi:membrane dipeptidase
MDGGFGAEITPTDVDTIADLQGFGPVLKKAGLSEDDVAGIQHGNALRLFRRVWS